MLFAVMLFGLIGAHAARAQPMRMMESFPAANAAIIGVGAQYSVRFDQPVDHQRSRLIIVQGERVIRVLAPRLTASPDTLFALAPRLPPGDYELHWSARAMRGAEPIEGGVPFTVVR